MKKYLMTIAAAAICAAFTSCSHDFETLSEEEIDQLKAKEAFAKYENAFIAAFGQPAATQDWGFGAGSTTRSFTRAAMPATPTFRDTNPIEKPTVPSQYKNTLAEATAAGAKYAKDYQNYQKGDKIYINTAYQTLNNPQNTEDLTIYVDGNVTYSGQTNQNGNGTVFCVTSNSTLKLGAVSNNLTVYLAPGATLDITPNSISFQNPKAAIYLSAGSKVKATDLTLIAGAKLLNDGGTIEASNLKLDQNATLWNEGSIKVTNTLTLTNMSSALYNKEGKTIETANLDLINNNALLFNEGTVTATGAVVLHNTDAEVINYGTLSCASYSQAAGGKTHNHGTVTMNGKTDLTNANSKWMNDGQWTCGSFDVDNYSAVNINNCRLTVNGNFHLNRGTFVLAANAGVVCNSFTWEDTSDFYLGSSSVLKINGDLLTKNANSGYGFRGYGTEYAVIQAARIYHEGNEQFRMSYYGKLLVATSNHFGQWYKDAPNTNQPAYWYESSVKFTKDGDNITTIPSSDCNPGYEGTNPPPVEATLRVMAEDLSATDKSDFDFNDVVFDVAVNANKTAAKIILRAAGGTLPLKINSLNGEGGWEVHDAFKVPRNTMVNTNAKAKGLTGVDNLAPVELGTITDDFSAPNIGNAVKNIRVEVYKNGSWMELEAKTGEACCKFACSPNNDWVKERNNIDDFYTFSEWVQGFETKLTKKGNW